MQATPVAELNANIIKAETLPETMNCSDEGASKFTMALGRPNAPYQERAGLRGLGRHYLPPSSGSGCWAITHTDWTYLHCIYHKTFASLIRHLCHLVTTAEYDQPPTGCPAAYFHILHTGSCLFA